MQRELLEKIHQDEFELQSSLRNTGNPIYLIKNNNPKNNKLPVNLTLKVYKDISKKFQIDSLPSDFFNHYVKVSNINNENILKPLKIINYNSLLAVAYEEVQGVTIYEYLNNELQEHEPDEGEARKLILELIDALSSLKKVGVKECDRGPIGPKDIAVDINGKLKILDTKPKFTVPYEWGNTEDAGSYSVINSVIYNMTLFYYLREDLTSKHIENEDERDTVTVATLFYELLTGKNLSQIYTDKNKKTLDKSDFVKAESINNKIFEIVSSAARLRKKKHINRLDILRSAIERGEVPKEFKYNYWDKLLERRRDSRRKDIV